MPGTTGAGRGSRGSPRRLRTKPERADRAWVVHRAPGKSNPHAISVFDSDEYPDGSNFDLARVKGTASLAKRHRASTVPVSGPMPPSDARLLRLRSLLSRPSAG